MLAYHFGGAAPAERAEEYLFRAGDEAARAAASSEALHFFQEASKLYFELHGRGGDRAKKSRLEKNVGLALFNGGRETDSVEHFDRALLHLGVPVPKSELRNQLRFVGDLLAVLWHLYVSPGVARRTASAREREIIEIMFQRALAQTIASPTRFLFDSLATMRRIVRVDARSIPSAGRSYAGAVGIFSYGGVSFGIGRRFLAEAERLLGGRTDAPDYLYCRAVGFIHHFLAGDWSEQHEVPDDVLEEKVRAGRLWEVVTYLGFLAEKQIRRGDYADAAAQIERCYALAEGFEYPAARQAAMGYQTYLLLEQGRAAEAVAAADDYYEESPQDLPHLVALAMRAEAQLRAGELAAAGESLARGEQILAGMSFGQAIPYHLSFHRSARYHAELTALESGAGLAPPAARLRKSRKAALASVAKMAGAGPSVFRLVGREAWLAGRHAAATGWWRRSLAAAERLGTRPERARTLHEIGLRLGSSGRARELPSGAECLAAAGALYAELRLEAELERLGRRELPLNSPSRHGPFARMARRRDPPIWGLSRHRPTLRMGGLLSGSRQGDPMLELAGRLRALERPGRSWLVACGLALLVAQPAWSLCEVIDFSAVKQRTRSTIDGELVSTLVATPAAAPGDSVLLEADFGCMVGTGFDPAPANNEVQVAVLKSSGGAFEDRSESGSFESFSVPAGSIEVLDCVGQACGTLRFVMPASGFAGPAEITVTRAGEVVARIFDLGARTAACIADAPDGLFGTFTLLPAYNPLQVSPAGAANPNLEAAVAGNGSLMLPIEFPLVGQAAVDASATRATGPEITKIPDQRFLRSLSHLFRPLPAIHRLVDPQGPNAALYSTADVPRGTLQILQIADPGGPNEAFYPDNFHVLRGDGAGPVVLPTAVTITLRGRLPGGGPALLARGRCARHQRRAARRPERRRGRLGPAALGDGPRERRHDRHRAGDRGGRRLTGAPRRHRER